MEKFRMCLSKGGRRRRLWKAPFHQSPTRAPGRLNPSLGFSRQASKAPASTSELLLTFSTSFLAPTSLPSLFKASYFGSLGSVSEMDFFRPTLRVMARGIWDCPQLVSGYTIGRLSAGYTVRVARLRASGIAFHRQSHCRMCLLSALHHPP